MDNSLVMVLILLVSAFLGGVQVMRGQNKRKEAQRAANEAEAAEREGEIDATLRFKQRVEAAEQAVRDELGRDQRTGDLAADLAERIRSSRRRRRTRQRDG